MSAITLTFLNGCTAPVYYNNVTYNDTQQALYAAQIDMEEKVNSVTPLENFIAKKAKIIIPNRQIAGIAIINKNWSIPKSGLDYLTEVNFLGFTNPILQKSNSLLI